MSFFFNATTTKCENSCKQRLLRINLEHTVMVTFSIEFLHVSWSWSCVHDHWTQIKNLKRMQKNDENVAHSVQNLPCSGEKLQPRNAQKRTKQKHDRIHRNHYARLVLLTFVYRMVDGTNAKEAIEPYRVFVYIHIIVSLFFIIIIMVVSVESVFELARKSASAYSTHSRRLTYTCSRSHSIRA